MSEWFQTFIDNNQTLLHLGLALLLGALIGIQRGWTERASHEGERVAGVRTHTLVALLGGLSVVLSRHFSQWILVLFAFCVALFATVGYAQRASNSKNYSMTGLVGLLLTFCFGALALLDEVVIAASAAVITALLLDNKEEIHALLNQLRRTELDAALKLLLISVVVLPLLPNQGMGPGDSINPYQVWWMVVLIAGISFIGYFAMRVGGAAKGILFTSLFAGLSSSTALTLHFSRMAKTVGSLSPLLASGILIACGTMFPRILLICALITPALLPQLLAPVLVMMFSLYLPALLIWKNHHGLSIDQPELKQNPLDLRAALLFGFLLLAILILGEVLLEWLGSAGVYLLAAAAGISDVDAITLSLSKMAQDGLSLNAAVIGIIIAASVNNLIKALLSLTVGSRALAKRVAPPMLIAVLLGIVTALLT